MATPRKSNIELLRIVSIVMVLIVHLDGASLGLPEPMGNITTVSGRDWWRLVVESFAIIGVNCFTLISGYFGIKAHWRGFVKFATTCLFYSVGIYLALTCTGLIKWQWTDFAHSFMVFTHTDLWYVPAYMVLYLLSPILNQAINTLDRQKYMWTIMALVAFNLYAGWWWGGSFNATGYSVMQLVMMYLIGQYIGRYGLFGNRFDNRKSYLTIYLIATAAIIAQSLYCNSLFTFAYNSPFVIIASVAFFMCFTTFTLQSTAINMLSASAFAVYLLHKNPYIWGGIIKPTSLYMWESLSLPMFTLATIAFVAVIYLVTVAIDRIRIAITSRI